MANPVNFPVPRITVIIPCFNAERHVREAINSVRLQTYRDWSLIAVDDGSTDSTLTVLTDIALEVGPRFLVRSGKNRGNCHARNTAIREASSEFVAFLDADDYWHPEKLRLQIDLLAQDLKAVGVTTAYKLTDPSSGRVSGNLDFLWSRRELVNWTLLGRRAPALNSTLMVRRKELIDVGGYDEALISYGEDLDLAWRLLSKGAIYSVGQNLVTLRVSDSQIHKDFSQMTTALGLVYDNLEQDEPLLARRAKINLRLYYGLRQTLRGSLWAGLARVIAAFLLSPVTSVRFVVRKVNDSGRLNLRSAERPFWERNGA